MPEKSKQYKQKLEYNNQYNRNNYKSFSVRFNNAKEKELIDWLNSERLFKTSD